MDTLGSFTTYRGDRKLSRRTAFEMATFAALPSTLYDNWSIEVGKRADLAIVISTAFTDTDVNILELVYEQRRRIFDGKSGRRDGEPVFSL